MIYHPIRELRSVNFVMLIQVVLRYLSHVACLLLFSVTVTTWRESGHPYNAASSDGGGSRFRTPNP
jgi:hypothetical protein